MGIDWGMADFSGGRFLCDVIRDSPPWVPRKVLHVGRNVCVICSRGHFLYDVIEDPAPPDFSLFVHSVSRGVGLLIFV